MNNDATNNKMTFEKLFINEFESICHMVKKY